MPKAIATTPSWYWPDRVPRVLGTPPYYIEELLVERWAHRQPAHPSLVSSDARTGAAELAESVRAVAAALTALTAPDRPVAVSAGPRPGRPAPGQRPRRSDRRTPRRAGPGR